MNWDWLKWAAKRAFWHALATFVLGIPLSFLGPWVIPVLLAAVLIFEMFFNPHTDERYWAKTWLDLCTWGFFFSSSYMLFRYGVFG